MIQEVLSVLDSLLHLIIDRTAFSIEAYSPAKSFAEALMPARNVRFSPLTSPHLIYLLPFSALNFSILSFMLFETLGASKKYVTLSCAQTASLHLRKFGRSFSDLPTLAGMRPHWLKV